MKQEWTRARVITRAIFSLILFVLVMDVSRAEAWWNKDWEHRRKVTIDSSTSGVAKDGLQDQALLVRIHAGNFNFAMAKPDGSDVRFIGFDDKTILKHQIIAWNQADEMALIWVKAPVITGDATKDGAFLYYGNPEAIGPEGSAGLTGTQQAMLLHLDETEGLPKDSTINGNNATSFNGGMATPAVIGNGISLFGGGERLSLAASPSLSLPDALTFSCWIRINSPQNDAYILHMGETWAADKKGLAVGINGMKLFLRTGDGSVTVVAPDEKSLQPDTWHHVAATIGKGEAVLFVDGAEAARTAVPNNPGPLAGVVTFGADPNSGHALGADIDELAIDNVVRPAAWIGAVYAIQGPDKGLVAVGIEEVSETGGMLAEQMHLMGIIFANLTLDAYVILGILTFMGIFAGSVFVYKTYNIWMSGKDTKAFLSAYHKNKGRTCGTDEDAFSKSPLYRVYKQGCREMQEVFVEMDDDRSETGEKLSLVGVRAAMDRSYILESKSLNSWLTALILCTSGGPFLGLLGTVWGVMNTFAAMAASGEANIMAIAPGVASALICTVTGMLVAIPSLMGYNYLLVKIKGLTIDLAVFVDEFGATLDKRYGGGA